MKPDRGSDNRAHNELTVRHHVRTRCFPSGTYTTYWATHVRGLPALSRDSIAAAAVGYALSKRCSATAARSTRPSSPAAAVNCNPSGRPLEIGMGIEIAGTPSAVQGEFMRLSPVEPSPNGAGPVGAIDFRRQEGLLRRPRQRLTTAKAYTARKRHAATACLFAW